MKYYLIAGEASGDLHASNLMKELKKLDSKAEFRCWGGDKMQAAGGTIVKHYRELAFMGFTEVLLNIRTIFANIALCKKDIVEWKPDTVIFVDYPGFNLRIAPFVKELGIKTVWYISPQVWAWKASRVKKLKASVDKMIVILPFEKEFYKKWNYEVEYVGHPLLDSLTPNPSPKERGTERLIALLPGSRKQEISVMLPIMLKVVEKFPACQFVIAGAPSVDESFYKQFTFGKNVEIVINQTYSLLEKASAALVTSGTATLETALFGVPEIVCYKGSGISYQIAKWLIKVKYISLVNLIMDKEVVKELIQEEMNAINIENELKDILENKQRITEIKKNYTLLREKLGDGGASAKAAKSICKLVSC
ncbi:MAG: Lipid-A-disaccharide synthase [Bacteroidia bacterium]|nr:Lipid-A-disaccharide synthase [Bacteroidia bacterium]